MDVSAWKSYAKIFIDFLRGYIEITRYLRGVNMFTSKGIGIVLNLCENTQIFMGLTTLTASE